MEEQTESTFDPETGNMKENKEETTVTTTTETTTPVPDTRAPEERSGEGDENQANPDRDETAGGVFSPDS